MREGEGGGKGFGEGCGKMIVSKDIGDAKLNYRRERSRTFMKEREIEIEVKWMALVASAGHTCDIGSFF